MTTCLERIGIILKSVLPFWCLIGYIVLIVISANNVEKYKKIENQCEMSTLQFGKSTALIFAYMSVYILCGSLYLSKNTNIQNSVEDKILLYLISIFGILFTIQGSMLSTTTIFSKCFVDNVDKNTLITCYVMLGMCLLLCPVSIFIFFNKCYYVLQQITIDIYNFFKKRTFNQSIFEIISILFFCGYITLIFFVSISIKEFNNKYNNVCELSTIEYASFLILIMVAVGISSIYIYYTMSNYLYEMITDFINFKSVQNTFHILTIGFCCLTGVFLTKTIFNNCFWENTNFVVKYTSILSVIAGLLIVCVPLMSISIIVLYEFTIATYKFIKDDQVTTIKNENTFNYINNSNRV